MRKIILVISFLILIGCAKSRAKVEDVTKPKIKEDGGVGVVIEKRDESYSINEEDFLYPDGQLQKRGMRVIDKYLIVIEFPDGSKKTKKISKDGFRKIELNQKVDVGVIFYYERPR